MDNKVIGEFVNGSYFQIEISSGKHKLESKNSFGEHRGLVDLELKSNQEYYAGLDIMGLPGSAESSQAGAAGTSAVNPIAGSISSALLRQTSEETKAIMKFADERIPQTIKNLGLLIVKANTPDNKSWHLRLLNGGQKYFTPNGKNTIWCKICLLDEKTK